MKSEAGLTLIELMATLAIGAAVVGMLMPGFGAMITRQRAASAHNLLLATIQEARAHAVGENRATVVCPSRAGLQCDPGGIWEHGWIAFVDHNRDGRFDGADMLTRVETEESPDLLLRSSASRPKVSFSKRGQSTGNNITIRICEPAGVVLQALVINNGGRARVAQPAELARLPRCA